MQRYKPPMLFSTQKPASMHDAPDGDYVLHSETQAEIARLTAEVDRLTSFIRDLAKTGGAAQEKALRAVHSAARAEALQQAADWLDGQAVYGGGIKTSRGRMAAFYARKIRDDNFGEKP